MKKFITIIVAFMSVLTLWGQTVEEISINNLKNYLDYFQDQKEEVIRQALNQKLIQGKDTVLITRVINDAEYLYQNYENIATKNDTLSSEIERKLTAFCRTYFNNIIIREDSNKYNIYIETSKFLTTIKSYQDTFYSLHEQVKNILESQETDENNEDNIPKGLEDTEDSDQDSQPQDTTLLHVFLILSLIVGAASAIFAVLALRKVNSTDKELKKLKTKIDNIVKVDSSSKPRNNQTRNRTTYPAPATAKTEPTYPSQQSAQYNNVAVTPPPAPERKENVNKTPQETYLYANTNANGGIEFYKVTTENSGDKVFMIILKKVDDENGDFTIAPMSDNFMREVIANRDMFLPSTFCERIVGSPNPTRIEVDAKGKARKVGGKWQMQERMRIRLI